MRFVDVTNPKKIQIEIENADPLQRRKLLEFGETLTYDFENDSFQRKDMIYIPKRSPGKLSNDFLNVRQVKLRD